MKWPRYIVHADLNHCYAQMEEMFNPKLRTIPMAAVGDEQRHHGSILAKNDIARTYGIKTAETLRDAFRKCPNLYIVAPDYKRYAYYTERVKDTYRRYTDKVESFCLDEAWIDLAEIRRDKERRQEVAIDTIRYKYGFAKVRRLVTKFDEILTDFDPKGDHIIHPESWF